MVLFFGLFISFPFLAILYRFLLCKQPKSIFVLSIQIDLLLFSFLLVLELRFLLGNVIMLTFCLRITPYLQRTILLLSLHNFSLLPVFEIFLSTFRYPRSCFPVRRSLKRLSCRDHFVNTLLLIQIIGRCRILQFATLRFPILRLP